MAQQAENATTDAWLASGSIAPFDRTSWLAIAVILSSFAELIFNRVLPQTSLFGRETTLMMLRGGQIAQNMMVVGGAILLCVVVLSALRHAKFGRAPRLFITMAFCVFAPNLLMTLFGGGAGISENVVLIVLIGGLLLAVTVAIVFARSVLRVDAAFIALTASITCLGALMHWVLITMASLRVASAMQLARYAQVASDVGELAYWATALTGVLLLVRASTKRHNSAALIGALAFAALGVWFWLALDAPHAVGSTRRLEREIVAYAAQHYAWIESGHTHVVVYAMWFALIGTLVPHALMNPHQRWVAFGIMLWLCAPYRPSAAAPTVIVPLSIALMLHRAWQTTESESSVPVELVAS